jgi:hypothetical protein
LVRNDRQSSRRLQKHLDRHAIFCDHIQNEFRIAGAAFDFLTEVST